MSNMCCAELKTCKSEMQGSQQLTAGRAASRYRLREHAQRRQDAGTVNNPNFKH